jgi:hypothetical protein
MPQKFMVWLRIISINFRASASGIRALQKKISNSFQLEPAHDGGLLDRPRRC